ncbi:MAG: hypothetical protein DCF30_06335 [Hyphomicrobiales bacterium]|nr:MAG: hypothetical protein DCF30_06335 [Hyphomicrobiales bacterium]
MQSAKLPQVRLCHIIECIDGIVAATDGLTQREVSDSFVLMRALERAIQIISEAAKELPAELRAQEPTVPWADVIGIGNILRHEYHRVRDETLFAILVEQLPELRLVAMRLLSGIEVQRD